MEPVTPEEVTALFPDADEVSSVHLRLAALWLEGELARRSASLAGLTANQLSAVRMAVAARALALKAGVDGTLTFTSSAGGRGLKGIKLPGLELQLNPNQTDQRGNLLLGQADLGTLADQLLNLVFPASIRWSFPGAAR
ncbi:hypothetical protein D3875_02730 [Deinococcus cavernae]|uniref:Uncharacterized protein n=1 Tax=Deinococcus cavernae TaxID=2320857 RepID=A0A418VFS1_9DEIO|nr:hypothetical protein [Deinococcus cavernae]RJF74927.1 hypothetical protein D3875_02730 [Deinococcus cavernae]